MLAILNFLNAPNLPIFHQILMILVSKFMVHRALSDKRYLSLGLLSPLIFFDTDTILYFRRYNNMNEGQYILYKHTSLPFEVS